MFTSSMTDEVKQLEEEIEAVKDKIDDPVMCEKVRQYICSKGNTGIYKADAGLLSEIIAVRLTYVILVSGGTSQPPCRDSTFG